MADSVINNKKIAVNTIYLYIRMMLIMIVSLYKVRVILDALGIEDYGIYNVVGSVVAMLAFLRGTMVSASNRFFSVEMVNKNIEDLRKTFSISLNIYVIIALVILVIAETLGLWYVINKLNYPPARAIAVQIVFQLSLLSFIAQLLTVSYNAMIIAHERMNIYAYIGIAEVVLKLFLAFAIKNSPIDKFILYAILMTITDILLLVFYYSYCRVNFRESHYKFVWEKSKFKEILSYTGWNFMGQFAVVLRGQGINLLINAFFNPAVNAARAIAYQVESTSIRFSENFFSAVRPQLYKAYSNKEIEPLFRLIDRSTIMCTYMLAVIMLPLILNGGYILGLWLKEVPVHTELFMVLALINGFVDSMSNGVIVSVAATGKIKKCQIISSVMIAMNIPIAYLALRMGATPETTVIVSIVISLALVFIRLYLLKEIIPLFNSSTHLLLLIKIIVVTVSSYCLSNFVSTLFENQLTIFITSSMVAVLLTSIAYYYIVLSKYDCDFIKSYVLRIVFKKQ